MFTERSQINAWAKHAGFTIKEFVDGDRSLGDAPLGLSVGILRKH